MPYIDSWAGLAAALLAAAAIGAALCALPRKWGE